MSCLANHDLWLQGKIDTESKTAAGDLIGSLLGPKSSSKVDHFGQQK